MIYFIHKIVQTGTRYRSETETEGIMRKTNLSASEALEKLKEGNQRYLSSGTNSGDVSPQIREKTGKEGQTPYAIVITCSDSRVIPSY